MQCLRHNIHSFCLESSHDILICYIGDNRKCWQISKPSNFLQSFPYATFMRFWRSVSFAPEIILTEGISLKTFLLCYFPHFSWFTGTAVLLLYQASQRVVITIAPVNPYGYVKNNSLRFFNKSKRLVYILLVAVFQSDTFQSFLNFKTALQ